MPKKLIFNYQNIHGSYFPIINIYAAKDAKSAPIALSGLLDSGANISLFSKETAKALNINITVGKKIHISGISGKLVGYEHKIYLDILGVKLTCHVIFAGGLATSFNLIGRQDFFEKFDIHFLEKQRKVVLTISS